MPSPTQPAISRLLATSLLRCNEGPRESLCSWGTLLHHPCLIGAPSSEPVLTLRGKRPPPPTGRSAGSACDELGESRDTLKQYCGVDRWTGRWSPPHSPSNPLQARRLYGIGLLVFKVKVEVVMEHLRKDALQIEPALASQCGS